MVRTEQFSASTPPVERSIDSENQASKLVEKHHRGIEALQEIEYNLNNPVGLTASTRQELIDSYQMIEQEVATLGAQLSEISNERSE